MVCERNTSSSRGKVCAPIEPGYVPKIDTRLATGPKYKLHHARFSLFFLHLLRQKILPRQARSHLTTVHVLPLSTSHQYHLRRRSHPILRHHRQNLNSPRHLRSLSLCPSLYRKQNLSLNFSYLLHPLNHSFPIPMLLERQPRLPLRNGRRVLTSFRPQDQSQTICLLNHRSLMRN